MGFRNGAYAKIWNSEDKGKYSVVELSTSKKNKETDEYETDFSSKFVRFIGAAHEALKKLGDRTRVKLGSVEVTNSYNKDTKKGYTNFLVYSIDEDEEKKNDAPTPPKKEEFVPDNDSDELPF